MSTTWLACMVTDGNSGRYDDQRIEMPIEEIFYGAGELRVHTQLRTSSVRDARGGSVPAATRWMARATHLLAGT